MQRIRFLTVILGTNGTGKTSFIKKMIKGLNSGGVKTLIVTPDDIEYPHLKDWKLENPKEFEFTGVRKHIFEPKHTFKAITDNYRRGALFLDDARDYLPANLENEQEFRKLMIRRRHLETDVFVVAHGFTDIPPKIFTYVNKYILFKTTDPVNKRKDTIRNYEEIEEAVNRINGMNLKKVDSFGKGRISYYEIISI